MNVDYRRRKMRRRVTHIMKMYGDPEAGHQAEDRLLWEFITNVAAGDTESEVLQREAQELMHLHDFRRDRWYA